MKKHILFAMFSILAITLMSCGVYSPQAIRPTLTPASQMNLDFFSPSPSASMPLAQVITINDFQVKDAQGILSHPSEFVWLATSEISGLAVVSLDTLTNNIALVSFIAVNNQWVPAFITATRSDVSAIRPKSLLGLPSDHYLSLITAIGLSAGAKPTNGSLGTIYKKEIWLSQQRTFLLGFIQGAALKPATGAFDVQGKGFEGWSIHNGRWNIIVAPLTNGTLVLGGLTDSATMTQLIDAVSKAATQIAEGTLE